MDGYSGIIIFGLISAGFAVTMLLLATFLGPKHKTNTKDLPFECGAVSVGEVQNQRFNVRFYMVAMLFILFDIEVVFMYPWALSLLQTQWVGFINMLVFVAVLSVGLAYVWKKGVFNWND
jgi:NADH-quinone oxidoreductase subunit A